MQTINTFQAAEAVIEDAFREHPTLPHNLLVLAATLATQARRPRMRQLVTHQLQAMTQTERDVFLSVVPIPSDILSSLGEPVEIDPLPAPEPPAPTLLMYITAIERQVEATARQRNYSGSVACATYLGSTNPTWAAEAAAFVAWRDCVWAYAFTQLAAVEAGGVVPSIEDALAGLPAIAWPEA